MNIILYKIYIKIKFVSFSSIVYQYLFILRRYNGDMYVYVCGKFERDDENDGFVGGIDNNADDDAGSAYNMHSCMEEGSKRIRHE